VAAADDGGYAVIGQVPWKLVAVVEAHQNRPVDVLAGRVLLRHRRVIAGVRSQHHQQDGSLRQGGVDASHERRDERVAKDGIRGDSEDSDNSTLRA
jgi:hypothetical protein